MNELLSPVVCHQVCSPNIPRRRFSPSCPPDTIQQEAQTWDLQSAYDSPLSPILGPINFCFNIFQYFLCPQANNKAAVPTSSISFFLRYNFFLPVYQEIIDMIFCINSRCICSKWKSLSHVQLFATPWTGQWVEFSRAEMLEWVVVPFSNRSSQPTDQTQVSNIAGRFFTSWATRETHSSEVQSIQLWATREAHCSEVQSIQKNDLIYIHYEVIITINLVNIQLRMFLKNFKKIFKIENLFFLVMRTL